MNLTDIYNFIDTETSYANKKDFIDFNKVLSYMKIDIDKFNVIHVAGTNGKGSTSGFISSILVEMGKNIGLFSSPHVSDYRERIKFNNKKISEEVFIEVVSDIIENYDSIKKIMDRKLNYFELSFLIALIYFNKLNLDYIVIETGIGGREDITNIFRQTKLSVITTISKDHTESLGNTLEDIASHKAGIIKENSKVVSLKHNDEIDKVILAEAKNKNSLICFLDIKDIEVLDENLFNTIFKIKKYNDYEFKLNILGKHQIVNAALAIKAVSLLENIDNLNIINKAISEFKLTGRMEKLHDNPTIIIDGAHNLEALNALYINIKDIITKDDILLFGCMKDKENINELKKISELFENIILTKAKYERAISPYELKDNLNSNKNVYVELNSEDALKRALQISSKDSRIICTGSFYLIGEIKEAINKK